MDDVRHYTGTLVADLHLPHAQQPQGPAAGAAQPGAAAAEPPFLGGPDRPGRTSSSGRSWPSASSRGAVRELDELLDEAERIIFAGDFEVADLRRLTQQDSFASGG